MAHLFKESPNALEINSQPAFAAKTLPDGKRLFRRKHGFNITVDANGNNELVLTVPYAAAKINELELVNCEAGDKVDFMVYDSEQGLYQINILGMPAEQVNPNLMLNQFGFGVYLPDGAYKDISKYDADVYGTMRLKIKYYNNSAIQRTIYGNIVYHEVKE
ncbi:MAG: hypothetical protein HWN81_00005 [Candidatus Lokiarchaeota archaeon]|nr:hypothetical protein [Candidatus Lokiarchaeota archaeon]